MYVHFISIDVLIVSTIFSTCSFIEFILCNEILSFLRSIENIFNICFLLGA